VASVIFCDKLKKGLEQLTNRGVLPGPIQDGGDTQFFEIRDTEGNVIQICKEPLNISVDGVRDGTGTASLVSLFMEAATEKVPIS
jgi:hypothetical protein